MERNFYNDWNENMNLLRTIAYPVIVFLIVESVLSLITFCLLCNRWKQSHIKSSRVMLFTAHPDDEVMFFGPTLVNMLKEGVKIYLVCFSSGLEERRVDELWACCEHLGIPSEQVILVKDDLMPDSPKIYWPQNHLVSRMIHFIETYEVTAAITFDGYGVSGHLNHISVGNALTELSNKKVTPYCQFYSLQSVNLLRKYTLMLDFFKTFLTSEYIYLCPLSSYPLLVESMSRHASQLVWFRKLYIFFSRYMYINSFKKIKS